MGSSTRAILIIALTLLWTLPAAAQKRVFLNPSDQTWNPVAGGGNEAQYALINAKLTKAILVKAGFSATVDQDFKNAPKNANSWGADIFVSFHSNAGGGHGAETLYVSSGGKALADKVQSGLLAQIPYQSRGLKHRTDLHVLNATSMYACLNEAVFHDCSKTSGYKGHPPSEASFLKSASGQQKIATGIADGVCAYFNTSCSGPEPETKGWLKGIVYRAPDMQDRLEGAKVVLGNGKSTVASETGAWSFKLLPGKYTVTAEKPGFLSSSSEATVVAGEETWASIGLEPAAPSGDAGPDGVITDEVLSDGEVEDEDGGAPRRRGIPEDGCSCATSVSVTATELGGLWPWLVLLGLALARRRFR
jgi:N-acetylmuramoyl-L-alanine amidase